MRIINNTNLIHKKAVILAAILCVCGLWLGGCGNSDGRYSNSLGEAAMADGRYKEAVTAFRQAIAYDDTCPEYYVNQGMAYLGLEDTESATDCFEQAIALDEENMEAYRGLGIACLQEQNYLEAVDAFETAVSFTGLWVGTLDYDILEYKAEAQMLGGLTEDAIETYSALIELDYHVSENYYRRGVMKLMCREYDAAIEDFDKAVSGAPENYSLYIEIYYSLCQYQYPGDAASYLYQALKVAGTSDEDYLAQGEIYVWQEDYESALNAFDQVQELSQNGQLYLSKALCYVALSRYSEAEQQYARYIQEYHEDPRVCNELAVCYMKQGNYEAAVELLARAVLMEGAVDIPEIKWNLIIAYEGAGETELAYATVAEYIANYPPEEQAQAEYIYLQKELGIYLEEETGEDL